MPNPNYTDDYKSECDGISARILNQSDFDSVKEIWSLNDERLLKYSPEGHLYCLNFMNKYLSDNFPSHKLVGSFNTSGEMISMLGIVTWNTLPIATILSMVVDPKFKGSFDLYNNGLMLAVDMIFKIGEDSGVDTFYNFQATKKVRPFLLALKNLNSPRLSKYYSFLAERVKAGEKPRSKDFFHIIDSRVWSYDIDIRCARRKPEHLEEYYSF